MSAKSNKTAPADPDPPQDAPADPAPEESQPAGEDTGVIDLEETPEESPKEAVDPATDVEAPPPPPEEPELQVMKAETEDMPVVEPGVEVQDVEKQEVVSNFGSEAPAEEKDPSVDGEIPIIIMSKEDQLLMGANKKPDPKEEAEIEKKENWLEFATHAGKLLLLVFAAIVVHA